MKRIFFPTWMRYGRNFFACLCFLGYLKSTAPSIQCSRTEAEYVGHLLLLLGCRLKAAGPEPEKSNPDTLPLCLNQGYHQSRGQQSVCCLADNKAQFDLF